MNSLVTARLTAPIAAVSGLLLVMTIVAAWYVRDMQQRTSGYVRDMQQRTSGPIATSVASVSAALELESSVREMNEQFNKYLISLDREDLKRLDGEDGLKRQTERALENAKKEATTPAELALMEKVQKGLKRLFKKYEEARVNPPKQGFYQEIRKLTEEVLEKEILAPSREYVRLNQGMLAQANTTNQAMLTQADATNQQFAERLTVGLVTLGVFGSVGGLLAGWVIASAARRSMQKTEERLRDTAEQLTRVVPQVEQAGAALKGQDALERVATSVSAVLRRLEKSEQDALRAEQLASVGQMAAGIAHEVRNPLMAIKLLVQAAGERPGGIPSRDIRVLEEEIGRLEVIVSGFLDFARPPRPQPRPVDVRSMVEEVVENFRPRAEPQGVELSVSAEPGVRAVADPNQLRQVLYNLLFNALDVQPDGGHIRVLAETDHEGGITVTVEDGGPGIPPELGDRIFEPFVSTKETGVGLGLSVCRRIAESHGGTLTAEPREHGAAFVLTLPPAQTPAALVH